jgi:uncharacterized protein
MNLDLDLCREIAGLHPYPLLFATISGAHLYGFPSSDSDYDLRGVHLLPLRELLSLAPPRDTVESEGVFRGVEIDLVTHDAAKFIRLMLKRNGYVLEQLLSPLVVQSSPEHAELRELAARCITRHHAHHYLGFAATQRRLFLKEEPPRVKPLLYVYRVLLTGIHLMRTGKVEANLVHLDAEFRLPYIADLVSRKLGGAEQQTIATADLELHGREYVRLVAQLEDESRRSSLPDEPQCRDELDALLIRLRLHGHEFGR